MYYSELQITIVTLPKLVQRILLLIQSIFFNKEKQRYKQCVAPLFQYPKSLIASPAAATV